MENQAVGCDPPKLVYKRENARTGMERSRKTCRNNLRRGMEPNKGNDEEGAPREKERNLQDKFSRTRAFRDNQKEDLGGFYIGYLTLRDFCVLLMSLRGLTTKEIYDCLSSLEIYPKELRYPHPKIRVGGDALERRGLIIRKIWRVKGKRGRSPLKYFITDRGRVFCQKMLKLIMGGEGAC